MNPNILSLYNIAQKKERIILGLMSGTSLDGLDLALCKFSGNGFDTRFEILEYNTTPYTQDFFSEIEKVFCKENVSLQMVCLLNNYIAQAHSSVINETLTQWKIDKKNIDVIASHGQTIYHAPKSKHSISKFSNATLQIGDGDIIAHKTGIITISDFRQKNIAGGGSGAPLALYGDYFLCSNKDEDRVLLNIGGIANLTYLPCNKSFDNVICTDTGPGNTLMNNYAQKNFNIAFDEAGKMAAKGKVDEQLLSIFLQHDFFNIPFPKTTGQEIFNEDFISSSLQALHKSVSLEDVMATLNMLTATSIARALQQNIISDNYTIYISGGGWYNKTLVDNLHNLLPGVLLKPTDDLLIPSKAKEALLFAFLANETLLGEGDFYNTTQTNYPAIRMGKISFPT